MPLSEDDPLLLEAISIFEEEGYSYQLKLSASMMWVTNKSGNRYSFYPTTGRWAPFGRSTPDRHYRSRGTRDFVDRFLKPKDELNSAIEEDRSNLLPDETKSVSLREFLEFVYEEFEDGKSMNQVYYDIINEHKAKFGVMKYDRLRHRD
jgi:hypothetical protein